MKIGCIYDNNIIFYIKSIPIYYERYKIYILINLNLKAWGG
jgi:hypothetical protein